MNTYRNKKTGVVIEIPSEFGNTEVWEKISPTPAAKPVKAEPVKEEKAEKLKTTAPKKTTTAKRTAKK